MAEGSEWVRAAAEIANTSMQIAAQGELYEKTRQWNEEMWNRTNEYNSPASQLARLREAGLNPNMLYGSIHSGQASNLTLPDAYGAKAIGDTLRSMNIEAMTVGIAKAKQELKGLKLDNQLKDQELSKGHYDIMAKSADASMRTNELAALEYYARSRGYRVSPDGAFFVQPDGSTIQAGSTNDLGVIPLFEKLDKELNYLSARTNDLVTKKELNDLRKETQGLINAYKTTENRWQPWLYGINAGTEIVKGIGGLVSPLTKLPRLRQQPYKYVSPYR